MKLLTLLILLLVAGCSNKPFSKDVYTVKQYSNDGDVIGQWVVSRWPKTDRRSGVTTFHTEDGQSVCITGTIQIIRGKNGIH